MVKFIFKKSWKNVHNVNDWIQKIHSSKYNEKGRSKLALAEFCHENNFESEMIEILKPILGSSVLIKEVEFEHHSKFDNYGKGRMQDLAIKGVSNGKKFFVGVEAKVNEPYGSSVKSNYFNAIKLKESSTNSKKKERIEEMLKKYFPSLNTESEISYQLLYSAVGTLCEIGEIHILAVLEFHTSKSKDSKIESNNEQFNKFLKAVNAKVLSNKNYYKANIAGKDIYICYKEI